MGLTAARLWGVERVTSVKRWESSKMNLIRVTVPEHEMYQKALELYHISFPAHEQREAVSQAEILGDEAYHFNLIYEEAFFVGLVLCWETERFLYVEHFCILPEMRNRKYGQKALELLKQQGKTVILEIDPPVDEIAVRRKGFYERCGFVENPYPHIHPPYHRGNSGHSLVIMTAPGSIGQEEYDAFRGYLEAHFMAGVFS